MFKYFRKGYDEKKWKEISYEKALDIMLGTWKDNDMTRDMLQTANWIQCRFSEIQVQKITEGGSVLCMMPGYYNMLPMGVEYDDDGNRIEEEK